MDKNKKDNRIDNGQNIPTLRTGSDDIAFLLKKIEKLSSALYMVTNFIPEKDALRDRLREIATTLISDVFLMQRPSYATTLREDILRRLYETLTLLSVAHMAGYVSSMNNEVLKKEYTELIQLLEGKNHTTFMKEYMLSGNFFTKDDKAQMKISNTADTTSTQTLKSPDKSTKNEPSRTGTGYITTLSSTQSQNKGATRRGAPKERRSDRRATILGLLERNRRISIKDVSNIITNCSEKTLQRELLAMVEEGVLNKEGERRWSTYTLS